MKEKQTKFDEKFIKALNKKNKLKSEILKEMALTEMYLIFETKGENA